jgi:hypothetical protein
MFLVTVSFTFGNHGITPFEWWKHLLVFREGRPAKGTRRFA